jgi:hypothetical protein
VDLPPVVLYELGGRYFVLDGNHRVSVARYQGVQWIEAEVLRLYVGVPGATSNLDGIHQRAERPEDAIRSAAA